MIPCGASHYPTFPDSLLSVREEPLSEENSSAMQSFSRCLLFIFHTRTFIDFLPSLSSASSQLISAAYFSPSFFPKATEESQKMAITQHAPIIGGKHICFWARCMMQEILLIGNRLITVDFVTITCIHFLNAFILLTFRNAKLKEYLTQNL